MHLTDPENYDCWVAYLDGFDVGTDGVALFGLREWLAVRIRWSNLAWFGAVAMIAFPDSDRENGCRSQPAHAIATLIDVLEDYCDEREKGGDAWLASVFVAYDKQAKRSQPRAARASPRRRVRRSTLSPRRAKRV